MKKLFFLILAVAMVSLLPSCKKEIPFLEVSMSEFSVDAQGGAVKFTVRSNVHWGVKTSADWCAVSPVSADGTADATLKVSANSDHSPRTCTVTITAGELTARIEVTQGLLHGLLPDKLEYRLTSAAQTLSIGVSATTPVSATVSDDAKGWISIQETKAMSPHSVVLSISGNESYDSRSGVVTIKGESGLEKNVKIVQTQKLAVLLSEHEYEFDGEQHTLELAFQASFEDYVVSVSPDAEDWIVPVKAITKALHDGKATFSVKANPSGDEGRQGMIIISNKSEDVSECVTVLQRAADILEPQVDVLMISGDAQEFTVPFASNKVFDYQVTEGSSWLSRIDTKSVTHYALPFAAQANDSGASRVGTVKFLSDGGKSAQMDIRQLSLGKGVIRIVSEGTVGPLFLYRNAATWQYIWDGGSVSNVNEGRRKSFDDPGSHVTKVLVDGDEYVRMFLAGVREVDLRQF